jgi:hypothetical protein
VRGTTTIFRVFKANGPQFVYQNRRAVRQDAGMPTRSPRHLIRGPHRPFRAAGRGDRAVRETARSPCRRNPHVRSYDRAAKEAKLSCHTRSSLAFI